MFEYESTLHYIYKWTITTTTTTTTILLYVHTVKNKERLLKHTLWIRFLIFKGVHCKKQSLNINHLLYVAVLVVVIVVIVVVVRLISIKEIKWFL